MPGVSSEITDFITQFFQNMSQGQMQGGFMGAGGPPAPPVPMGPARAGYAGGKPQRGPRNVMYGSGPPPQQPKMTSYGGPPPPIPSPFQQPSPQPPMMMGGNQNQFPQGPPPGQIPRNVPIMHPEAPMEGNMEMMPPAGANPGMEFGQPVINPPVNVSSEEAIYNNYYNEMTKSSEYTSADDDEKRTKFGDLIYPYVESLSGPESAPKITGMIIDLELNDLEQATSSLASLKEKISEGMELLADEGGD